MSPDDPAAPPPTATERVCDTLYTDILERRLAPGTRLREEELAARFAVSRTVIRQALHRLAQDQVITLHHNRGAQVPAPTRADAAHVFDARRVVECEIARRLAGRLQPEQRVQLEALVEAEARADAAGDRSAAIRLSGDFHRALAQMCGNPVFVRLLEGLLPTTSLLMALYQPAGASACVLHRHVELISALGRPGTGAATEMRRHLQEIEQSLRPARDVFKAYRAPTT
ncbi:GntR family transcriptional regulator [Sphaerotilus sp.]|uniref:GntR family transcriptional regulator n=1 Tax=Sphaerotilus sp. TaxID=2093942 RepID=UPI002ACD9CB6|nr:GntR family transcriptional regulator [Sphaerotilus sp.]MDZ7857283.1 GntR family transcriptional regulator [Sphaerotilus sp.]